MVNGAKLVLQIFDHRRHKRAWWCWRRRLSSSLFSFDRSEMSVVPPNIKQSNAKYHFLDSFLFLVVSLVSFLCTSYFIIAKSDTICSLDYLNLQKEQKCLSFDKFWTFRALLLTSTKNKGRPRGFFWKLKTIFFGQFWYKRFIKTSDLLQEVFFTFSESEWI